ncbi:MAG: hypothetical protein IPM18_14675 [Phycisphaerales bacterium]|nr:hypothetical protein [Phycisphaerales bacterium]
MNKWLANLRDMNRRWLYLATFLVVLIPILVPLPLPNLAVSDSTRALFEYIDGLPPEAIVMIDSSWDAGSLAENEAQLKCVVRHLCERRIRFVVTSIGIAPLGPEFARLTIRPIAGEYGYEYGRDWVNAGFVQGIEGSIGAVIDGAMKNFRQTFPADSEGTPVAELPLLADFNGAADAALVYIVTYAPAPEWISFVREQFRTPVAFGAMSIMAPQYINNFRTGQLQGLLLGNRGAAEYEQLLGVPGQGARLAVAGSFGVLAVILAAILGNLVSNAVRAERRAAR